MGAARDRRRPRLREVALIVVAAIYVLPFLVLLGLALETSEQTVHSPLAFHRPPHLSNFSDAWSKGGQASLGPAMKSSAIITIASVAGLVVLGSLCAYTIARRRSRVSTFLYLAFVLGIVLPVQLAIIPLYVAMREIGLVGNYVGMILLNIGLLMPLTVFLYTGFIRALPQDYEEAARVDGAGLLRTYARVVLPLLWPITATVSVFLGIIVWNEYFIALVFLQNSSAQTLPVALAAFAGEEAAIHWNLVMAGVAIAVAPILAVYLLVQRRLIHGFSAGVKG